MLSGLRMKMIEIQMHCEITYESNNTRTNAINESLWHFDGRRKFDMCLEFCVFDVRFFLGTRGYAKVINNNMWEEYLYFPIYDYLEEYTFFFYIYIIFFLLVAVEVKWIRSSELSWNRKKLLILSSTFYALDVG